MELEGELGGYDFVCRVRFGNRHAIADRGILVRQQIPQNREIYQFQIHKERNEIRQSPQDGNDEFEIFDAFGPADWSQSIGRRR